MFTVMNKWRFQNVNELSCYKKYISRWAFITEMETIYWWTQYCSMKKVSLIISGNALPSSPNCFLLQIMHFPLTLLLASLGSNQVCIRKTSILFHHHRRTRETGSGNFLGPFTVRWNCSMSFFFKLVSDFSIIFLIFSETLVGFDKIHCI